MATKSGSSSTIKYTPSLPRRSITISTPPSPAHPAPLAPSISSLLRSVDRPAMDGIQRKQYGFKSNAHQGVATSSSSPGKRKGTKKALVGGGGKTKPPIKVVFIGNPVRVTTSEAGFRALVQELTGRHSDPYKYDGSSSSAAIDVDAADDSSGAGSQVEPLAGALQLPSPVSSSTPSSDAASAGAVQVSVPAYDDEDEDRFAPQLIDNSYSVFSPPTFLYGGPHGELL